MQAAQADSEETRKLLAEVRAGDSQALGPLLTRHQPYLQRFVELRLDPRLRVRLDPADVVQEAQLQAVRRLPRYLEQNPMPFRLWLRQLAQDRLLQPATRPHRHCPPLGSPRGSAPRRFRSRDRLSASGVRLQPKPAPEPAGIGPAGARSHGPPVGVRPRSAAPGHFEGLSNPEVAALLDLTPGTVSKRYGRAVLRLHHFFLSKAG